MSMNAPLPDVAREQRAEIALPLDWVGMRGIALPVRLPDGSAVAARAAIAVDLPDAQAKGIHMSRLYLLLEQFSAQACATPAALHGLLQQMRASHADCAARAARLQLDFELLLQRPALVTPGLAGWKSYPVSLEAELHGQHASIRLALRVAYSSTCPCSAALSRQALQDAFAADFSATATLAQEDVLAWLSRRASLATPHSQRSEARLEILLPLDGTTLPLGQLIDVAEAALGTPVQTAVRRADEQAFALRNGANLMYVEDAARRLQLAISTHFGPCAVDVSHVESLHAHDAVAASTSPGWQERPR